MTDQTKPVARPGETLVHLHFINPDTNDRSTWIGTCAHRALLRDADGRLNLEVMIDIDGDLAPAPVADRQSAPDTAEGRLTDLIDRWKIDTYPGADLMPSADAMPAFLADIDTVLRDLRRERNGHIGTMRERDRAAESALAVVRASAADGATAGLSGVECAALAQHIDQLTADLAEARRQVQAACCGPWHERETTEADAAAFPWGRVKAAREVAARWHSHAHWQASQGPHEATVAWAVAQTLLSLVLDELDYDGIESRGERETGPAETRTCTGCDGTGRVAIEDAAESGAER